MRSMVSTTAALALLLGACASSGEKKEDGKEKLKLAQDEVAAAEKAGDEAKLKQICETEGHLAGAMACRSVAAKHIKSGDVGVLLGNCAQKTKYATAESCKAGADQFKAKFQQLSTPCGAVEKLYDSMFKHFDAAELQGAKPEVLTLFVKRALACKLPQLAFGKMVTSEQGLEALNAAAASDAPYREVLMAFLDANPTTPFGTQGVAGSRKVFDALVAANKVGECADFDKYASQADDMYLHQLWAPFFAKTKCAAADKTVAKLLNAKGARQRMDGCKWLAEMGAKKQLKAMSKVMKKDKVFVEKDGKKVYTVRQACAEAMVALKKQ